MSVYVDAVLSYSMEGANAQAQSHGERWCHLVADTDDELHALAAKIGLRRSWHQTAGGSHYDLVPSKRAAAVRAGAVEIDHTQLAWITTKQKFTDDGRCAGCFGRGVRVRFDQDDLPCGRCNGSGDEPACRCGATGYFEHHDTCPARPPERVSRLGNAQTTLFG